MILLNRLLISWFYYSNNIGYISCVITAILVQMNVYVIDDYYVSHVPKRSPMGSILKDLCIK